MRAERTKVSADVEELNNCTACLLDRLKAGDPDPVVDDLVAIIHKAEA